MILRYSIAWIALAVIAIANGIIREYSYGKWVSELTAHQLSTISAIALSGLLVFLLHHSWPLQSSGQAWVIGGVWLGLTIIFEFGFGHFIVGHTWSRLFADYNLFAGRLWLLFLVWILIVPNVVYRYG